MVDKGIMWLTSNSRHESRRYSYKRQSVRVKNTDLTDQIYFGADVCERDSSEE
jgi:hypothetical protein